MSNEVNITITKRHEELRKALYKHLSEVFSKFGFEHCSGELKLTRRFLRKAGLKPDEVKEMLYLVQYFGGYCDCEVVLNVDRPFPVGKIVHALAEELDRK